METKIIKTNDNSLNETSKLSWYLDHVQIYAKYVQPNHLSVVDVLVYHESLFEHPSD